MFVEIIIGLKILYRLKESHIQHQILKERLTELVRLWMDPFNARSTITLHNHEIIIWIVIISNIHFKRNSILAISQ